PCKTPSISSSAESATSWVSNTSCCSAGETRSCRRTDLDRASLRPYHPPPRTGTTKVEGIAVGGILSPPPVTWQSFQDSRGPRKHDTRHCVDHTNPREWAADSLAFVADRAGKRGGPGGALRPHA